MEGLCRASSPRSIADSAHILTGNGRKSMFPYSVRQSFPYGVTSRGACTFRSKYFSRVGLRLVLVRNGRGAGVLERHVPALAILT
jgi:hypothetical protein